MLFDFLFIVEILFHVDLPFLFQTHVLSDNDVAFNQSNSQLFLRCKLCKILSQLSGSVNYQLKQKMEKSYPQVIIQPSAEIESKLNGLEEPSQCLPASPSSSSSYVSKLNKSKQWCSSDQAQDKGTSCGPVSSSSKNNALSSDKEHVVVDSITSEDFAPSDISVSKNEDPRQPPFLTEREGFSQEVYRKYPWVEFSLSTNQVFCYACRHHCDLSDEIWGHGAVYTVLGSERNSKILAIIDEHEQMKKHKKSFCNWIMARNKLLLTTRPYGHHKKKVSKKKGANKLKDEDSPSLKKRKLTKVNKQPTSEASGTEAVPLVLNKSPTTPPVAVDGAEEPVKIQK